MNPLSPRGEDCWPLSIGRLEIVWEDGNSNNRSIDAHPEASGQSCVEVIGRPEGNCLASLEK